MEAHHDSQLPSLAAQLESRSAHKAATTWKFFILLLCKAIDVEEDSSSTKLLFRSFAALAKER